MALSGKAADKLIFVVLYAGLMVLTCTGGVRLVNYALDHKFYEDFLLKWEIAMRNFAVEGIPPPEFTGSNHVAYMEALIESMRRVDITPPVSNTSRRFVYRIEKVGDQAREIFLLAAPGKMMLYGLDAETLNRLDQNIDGSKDLNQGRLTAYRSKDGITFIGVWQL
jgi:hypothetical protein